MMHGHKKGRNCAQGIGFRADRHEKGSIRARLANWSTDDGIQIILLRPQNSYWSGNRR